MYDLHYDFLTAVYMAYKNNNYAFIKNWAKNYNMDNVCGFIANLCFMSKYEMEEEYH